MLTEEELQNPFSNNGYSFNPNFSGYADRSCSDSLLTHSAIIVSILILVDMLTEAVNLKKQLNISVL